MNTTFARGIALVLALLAGSAHAAGRLLTQADLVYLGAFRVPAGQFGPGANAVFDYSDDGLAFNAANNSLFIKGHTYGQMVAEITIPALVNTTNRASLNTAKVRQNFADITEGNLNQQNIANGMILGGLLVSGSKLIGAEWAYYDGSAQQSKSHFTSGLTLATTGDYAGMFPVGSLFPAFVGGYMAPIPSEWQASFGGPALTGHCCTSIISHQSLGPSASVFDPARLGTVNPVPATPVVYYTTDHPTLGQWGHPLPANPVYNISTLITGVVFPPGTSSVLFFGRTGLGQQCYGEGTGTTNIDGVTCYDPSDPYKGTHAYPYAYYAWAYDANDLVAVKNGTRQPWDVKPYASWQFSLPFAAATDSHELNGAAYDPATGRIYLAQKCADDSCRPIIHAFQIASAPTSSPLPAPTNLRTTP